MRTYALITEAGPTLFFPMHTANLHMGSTNYYDSIMLDGLCT